jgi:hypothetical protein
MDYLDCKGGLLDACWAALPAIRDALATPDEAALDTLAALRVAPLAATLVALGAARTAAMLNKGPDARSDEAKTKDADRKRQLTELVAMVRQKSPWWNLGIVPTVLSVLIYVGMPEFEEAFSTSYPTIMSKADRQAVLKIFRAAIGSELGRVLELHEKERAHKALNKVVNACRDKPRVLHLSGDRCPTTETLYGDVEFLAKDVARRFDSACFHSQALSWLMTEALIIVRLGRLDDPALGIAWETISRPSSEKM